jgi:tol-pal system protein YbgF
MTLRTPIRFLTALLLLASFAAVTPLPAAAQVYTRPPLDDYDAAGQPPAEHDAAGLGMRVDRLERELRKMTGRVEELQHQLQVVQDQLRAQAATSLPPPSPAPQQTAQPERHAPPPSGRPAGGDAFDPAANPNAAGAPHPLGQTPASTPLPAPTPRAPGGGRDPGAPLDLTPQGAQAPTAAPPGPDAAAQTTVKEDYEQAVGMMRSQQYEAAERNLTVFLAKYPKSKYVPAATYGLGESFYMRQRYREAAEKFLEIKVKYAQSAQAPEALLRLGQSLGAIGAREQACASFSEIGVNYPGSAARVRDAASRESKKLQC